VLRIDECAHAAFLLRFGDDMEAIVAKLGLLDKLVEDAMVFAQVGKEQ